jgi:diguanylate cyclase (GGDEF)-like protein
VDLVKDRAKPRLRGWFAVAVLVVVAGTTGAVSAARSVASDTAHHSREDLTAAADDIASTLQMAIEHEEDLVVNANAFIASNPRASNAEFVRWADSVRALARYPEVDDIGFGVLVPVAQLSQFLARAQADPSGPWAGTGAGAMEVFPPGFRPNYCLGLVSLTRHKSTIPAGLDFCAGPGMLAKSLEARDSGRGIYGPFNLGDKTILAVEIPTYRTGVVPGTVAARRAAFLGWLGLVMDPSVLLRRALRGHPNTAVTFRFHDANSDAEFVSGKAFDGARSITTDLHNGWKVQTFGGVVSGGMFTGTALAMLSAGVLLSVLLGLLLFVLGTGRERALRLVGERTSELRHQALHDALTGLPNRALIMDRIEQLLVRNRRSGAIGAALFVDLDDFKNINDTLGHGAGDRLLMAVAARLESTLRDADTIGRMGGDEFVVLIDGASLEVDPEVVAEKLIEVMRQPFELEGAALPLMVNTSIGIAVGDRASGGDLLRDADVALYQAKGAGKNCYVMFHQEMQTEISRRLDLEFDLRTALAGEQFRLVYQPIYNLGDLTLVGVEALLRWEHPTRGLVPPDVFIPILERTGQILEVGRWVLHQACGQMAAWHARGDKLDISVNVSGRQLDHDTTVRDLREALEVSGLEATSLIIEVTETVLMHNVDIAARRLRAIKELGVRIAVDGFGAGYSSLAYLRQFPVDCLKIDRRFTNAITTSPESKALVGTLVQLGKDLGLSTLAEGVETSGEMDLLRAQEVNQAQGFLLARPLDALTLEAQLLAPSRTNTPSSDLH